MSETRTEVCAPQAFPKIPMCKSRRDEDLHLLTLQQSVPAALFSPIALNKLHIPRSWQTYWAAPFRRLSTVSICSKGPNSGCVTGDFLWPRRVCAFNISSSKSYTGTTFLHFMLRRCSIPLLLWRRTENKSVIRVWQCRDRKPAHGFKSVLLFIRS